MSDSKNELAYNGNKIEGFLARCDNCGSQNINIDYEFNYYGGATGYDQSLSIECLDCSKKVDLSI